MNTNRPAGHAAGRVDPRFGSDPGFEPFNPTRYMTSHAESIRRLSRETWGEQGIVNIIGLSSQIASVLHQVQKVAPFEEPILITGESGSGKESIAQAIYLLSPRAGRPFVSVNCPQYHEGNLAASEFFGHKRGSFTGAVSDRQGAFVAADTGAIFLDEVGDLPMSTQVMLLRVLQTGEFLPVGSTAARSVDVRVISATNRDLKEMRGESQFREDLFYRLSFFRIEVPPLRERQDDWALLAEYCLRKLCHRYGVAKSFSRESLSILGKHTWPGNVRELSSIVTYGFAMADGDLIHPDAFLSQIEIEPSDETCPEGRVWRSLQENGGNFWTTVYDGFMNRDLNRSQVQAIIRRALIQSQGSFRQMLDLFRLPGSDYQRMMDFLRHHRLKPDVDAANGTSSPSNGAPAPSPPPPGR